MQNIPPKTSDPHAALLTRFAQGDMTAARLLVADLGAMTFAHAQRLLGNAAEAEDVAQEAMLRLWRIAPDWEPDRARVTTWLYRVTGNLCIDRMRKVARQSLPLDLIAEPVDPAPGAEARILAAARAQALTQALQQLPERQRQAVVLRHIEGLTNPEIAQIMETGVEAVESLTARGKRNLSAGLAEKRSALGFDDDTTE